MNCQFICAAFRLKGILVFLFFNTTLNLIFFIQLILRLLSEVLNLFFSGLLGVAMEIQDIATDFDFRTRNDALIPLMIKRLKSCQKEASDYRCEAQASRYHNTSIEFRRRHQQSCQRTSQTCEKNA